ncbi:MAG: hypothetical protein KC418_21730, partial [Anaerolineales bacterium]|nr:hypothetical protein [Anaerolineales bacterium]
MGFAKLLPAHVVGHVLAVFSLLFQLLFTPFAPLPNAFSHEKKSPPIIQSHPPGRAREFVIMTAPPVSTSASAASPYLTLTAAPLT